MQRIGAIAFGAAFVLLFVIVGIAVGIGHPSPGPGEVAIVEGAPASSGTVTEAEVNHGVALVAAQSGLKSLPKPGEKQYEQMKETALNNLLDMAWLEGQAAEMGLSISAKEVAAELKKLKKANFKSEAEFKKFVQKSHYTPEDINERVKLTALGSRIQSKLTQAASKPSSGEVSAYYEAAKTTQFLQKATRDVRTIVNKDPKELEQAKALLEKHHTALDWKKIAQKYSTEPATKTTGGLRTGLISGMLEEPVNAAVFKAPTGRIEGPIKGAKGYWVFEVERETPEKIRPLSEVKSQIESVLSQRTTQEKFAQFVTGYTSKWTSRTFCASGFTTSRCANFPGVSHPPSAPPGCYEAHPKGPLPEACPAPVQQLTPALPGSISVLEPRGKPLPQRPRPAGPGETTPASGFPSTLPPGAAP